MPNKPAVKKQKAAPKVEKLWALWAKTDGYYVGVYRHKRVAIAEADSHFAHYVDRCALRRVVIMPAKNLDLAQRKSNWRDAIVAYQALQKYGEHAGDCRTRYGTTDGKTASWGPCTCGLVVALKLAKDRAQTAAEHI